MAQGVAGLSGIQAIAIGPIQLKYRFFLLAIFGVDVIREILGLAKRCQLREFLVLANPFAYAGFRLNLVLRHWSCAK